MKVHSGLISLVMESFVFVETDEQAFRVIEIPIRQKTRYFILDITRTSFIDSAIDLANQEDLALMMGLFSTDFEIYPVAITALADLA